MASSEPRINQFTKRKITGTSKGNKGKFKENKGKLKEKQGKLMENTGTWTGNKETLEGNKGKLKGNVFKFLMFSKISKNPGKWPVLNREFINLQEGKLKENSTEIKEN